MTSRSALEVLTQHHGPCSVLRLRGELDVSTDDDVRREIRAVLHSHNPQILVLDLSELAFTDSTGLLLLADPNSLILRLLHITGLDKELQLATEDITMRSPGAPTAAAPGTTPPAESGASQPAAPTTSPPVA